MRVVLLSSFTGETTEARMVQGLPSVALTVAATERREEHYSYHSDFSTARKLEKGHQLSEAQLQVPLPHPSFLLLWHLPVSPQDVAGSLDSSKLPRQPSGSTNQWLL